MASTINLQALGLNYSPNNLSLPDGSLIQADNVIIRRDNTVESRRGIKDYSNSFSSSNDRAKQLIEYKNRILAHIDNKLFFDSGNKTDGLADYYQFAGTYAETQDGLRIKSIEANKNLYFTTSEGIKKISARTADDFTTAAGLVQNAGAAKASDITATLDIYQGQKDGFLPQDSTVAYRVVWGYKDRNENLLLGTPSNRYVVYNYIVDSMAMDINTLCTRLDNINQSGCLINDGNYASSFYTPINTDTNTLKTTVTSLAKKLDADILLANTTGTGSPLKINSIGMDGGGSVSVFFENFPLDVNPNDLMAVNDYVNIQDLNDLSDVQITGITAGTTDTIINTNNNHNLSVGSNVVITGTNTFLDETWSVKEINAVNSFSIEKRSQVSISSVGLGATPKITTIQPHNLRNGNTVQISGSSAITNTTPVTTPGNVNGTYTVTVEDENSFTITLLGGYSVTTAGGAVGSVDLVVTTGNVDPLIDLENLNGKQVVTNITYKNATISSVTNGATTKFTTSSSHDFLVGDVVNIVFSAVNIQSVSNTAPSTYTVTTTNPHGLVNGDSVTIFDANETYNNGLNGVYTIFGVVGNTFKITSALTFYGVGVLGGVYKNTTITGIKTVSSVSGNDFYIDVDTSALPPITLTGDFSSAIKSSINFIYTPTAPNTVTAFNPVTISSQTVKINSYNYTILTETGDIVYSIPMNEISPSVVGTSEQNRIINNTILRIVDRLKIEKSGVIPTLLKTSFIDTFFLTDSANVKIDITIPTDVINNKEYFYQVYRTRTFTADGTQTLGTSGGNPLEADDEMRLVQEGFPTDQEFLQKTITFLDQSPQSLVANNTNLYTNPETGAGILNANEPPPFAKDINRFKNVVFYSNTRTKQKLTSFQLLGLSNIQNGDKITIASSVSSNTYEFVQGESQIVGITFTNIGISSGQYYSLYSAPLNKKYYFWLSVDGTGTEPIFPDGTSIKVSVLSSDTSIQISEKNLNVINTLVYDFEAEQNTLPSIKVTNINEGKVSNPDAGTSPFTFSVINSGKGEYAPDNKVLLSSLTSAAQAIEQTAQSLVRVINKKDAVVNAFYTSSETTPPGQMILEAKALDENPFYVMSSTVLSGQSFNPDISPIKVISGSNVINGTVGSSTFTLTSSSHGLENGDVIIISGSNSDPIIDGVYSVINCTTNTFDIVFSSNFISAGNYFAYSRLEDTIVSDNEIKPNRIYYSKANEPEAVPLLNYFDISAEDKEILRIYPLRNSLFVFKEDGTYRISGETAPFVVSLLDSSCVVRAPDSVSATNNIVYAWTTKGITPISEAGASQEVSRPIDTEILRLSSSKFINFKKITWGVGYDSDSSYTVYTNSDVDDDYATVGFRYCTLTNSWTNVTRSQTCGIINIEEDKMYLGSGITNIINQERKNFDRTDYADKDFLINLLNNSVSTNSFGEQTILVGSVSEINVGDVVTQEQNLSIFLFNNLLKQLDTDPSIIAAATNTYYHDLQAIPGDDIRDKIVDLAIRLDNDPGVGWTDYAARIDNKTGSISSNSADNPTIVTCSAFHDLLNGREITIYGTQATQSIPSINGVHIVSNISGYGTSTTFKIPVDVTTGGGSGLSFQTNVESFQDIKACFNHIIERLNSDPLLVYNSYKPITDKKILEAIVTSVNIGTNQITVQTPLDWIVGPITIYNAINCEIKYSPITMGDALTTKQLFDTTIMLKDRNITEFMVSFSSDLKPEFTDILFQGDGNGLFGYYPTGFGYGNFGGQANNAPFRTLIPLQNQRCRYLNYKINHKTAREAFVLYGISLTGNVGISFRGYR